MQQLDGDAVARELEQLKSRVDSIEKYLGLCGQVPAGVPEPEAAPATENPAGDVLPEIGRALLGLAGAYLLRAVTEAGALPVPAGVGIGIVYAMAWLVAAARTPAEHRFEAALRSLTSVLVLAPLLWEATLRFHAVAPWMAGAVLLAFTIFGLAVSWRKNLLVIATITTLAGLGTACGLLIASGHVITFTAVFLAMAAAIEISACFDHWLSERWLAALAADWAVLFATWLASNPRALPEGYAPIAHGPLLAAQVMLLAVYLTSTMVRTLFRGITMTWFETAQCAAAFAIVISGTLGPGVGIAALICGAACYVVSFAVLERGEATARNFYIYSTFGILLALVGTRVLLSAQGALAAWLILAIAAVAAGAFFGRGTLQLHGAVYLLLAGVVCGALAQAAALLLGAAIWPPPRAGLLIATAGAAALCYVLAGRSGTAAFRLVLAAAAFWFAAATLAGVLTGGYHAVFGASASHSYCATIRTGILVGLALAGAWAGTRWKRSELRQLAYAAIALACYRLLTVDLRQEGKVALVMSLLVVGSALTVLPRFRAAKA